MHSQNVILNYNYIYERILPILTKSVSDYLVIINDTKLYCVQRTICPTIMSSQSIATKKMLKTHNSYINRRIKITRSYDQLHILINHPTICESYRTKNFIEVAFTKRSWTTERKDEPKNSAPYYRMRGIKILYTKLRQHIPNW